MTETDRSKIELIMQLRQLGVHSAKVLSVLERVPREVFLSANFRDRAYDNTALPIECGQTISQPFVVAYMTEQLDLNERLKVLEVGTGSGYQAAVLSRLCRRVYTIERYRTLLKEAESRFEALGYHNITTKLGDGHQGWPEQAPFDRIIVTAAAEGVPETLVQQLKPGGVMIVPVEKAGGRGEQVLIRVERSEDGIREKELLPVRFVPLLAGLAPRNG